LVDLRRTCPACGERYPAQRARCPACRTLYRELAADIEDPEPAPGTAAWHASSGLVFGVVFVVLGLLGLLAGQFEPIPVAVPIVALVIGASAILEDLLGRAKL
jgi:uncharacterized membrane protein